MSDYDNIEYDTDFEDAALVSSMRLDQRQVEALERIAEVMEQFFEMKYRTDLVQYEPARGQEPRSALTETE